MQIDTKAFGQIEIEEKQVINFPLGIPGFNELRNFALLDSGQPPFYWLQSIEDVHVAFILIDPQLIRAEYTVDIIESEYASIGLSADGLNGLVFTIVTVRNGGTMVTANLQGPVVINREKGQGRQFISTNPEWEIQYDIMDALRQMRDDDADTYQKEG